MFDLTTTNREQTMSSLDFLNTIINPARQAAGENEVTNSKFLLKLEDELDDLGFGQIFQNPEGGRPARYYELTLEQMTLVGMRESKAVRRSVLETLKKLQRKETDEEIMIRGYMLTVKKYEQLQQTLIMKDAVIEVQEEQIAVLNNLFVEGTTISTFGKQLNGVNANALKEYVVLELDWAYYTVGKKRVNGEWQEYRSGCRSKSAARAKYLRDIVKEGGSYKGNPKLSYDIGLLKEGAAKLFSLYLEGKLPMKANWDGKFVHDVL